MKINTYNKQLESQFHGLILFALWLCVPSTAEYSVAVPLQLHAVKKIIAVLKSCFALLSSLLKKKKKKDREKGFREVREAQQFSQEHQN